MRRIRFSAVAWLAFGLALSLLVGGTAFAQERTGEVVGQVTDASGAGVPGATVIFQSATATRPIQVVTGAQGRFQLFNVPVGTYTVTSSLSGFSTHKQTIEIGLGVKATVNAILAVGAVTEVITVEGASPLIDTTSSRSATNINTDQLQNLPKVGRSFNSLLPMAPGVFLEPKNGTGGVGGVQVGGSSGSENGFYIDGAEVSDLRRGSLQSANAIPFEFIQEVQIKAGAFEAEFGGATGGVINVATRSGTNAFHGSVGVSFTGDALNSPDRGFWQRSPLNADVADFFQPKEDDYTIVSPSFTVGGPIIKDRAHFFLAYSPDRESTTRTIDYASGTRTFEQTRARTYSLARVDFAASSTLQLNASYIWSPSKREGSLPNRDIRVAAPSNDQSIQGGFLPGQTATAGLNWTPKSNVIVSARYGYKYANDKDGNYGVPFSPYTTYQTSSAAAGLPVPYPGGNGVQHGVQHPDDPGRRHDTAQRVRGPDLHRGQPHLQGRLRPEPRGQRGVQRLHGRTLPDVLG